MDKKDCERLKGLRIKDAKGTATFAERNILKMEEKRLRKKGRIEEKERASKLSGETRSTKRF